MKRQSYLALFAPPALAHAQTADKFSCGTIDPSIRRGKSMTQERIHTDANFDRAEQWYEERIRSVVETDENLGKVIAIDVETGDYEITDLYTSLEATKKILAKNPGTKVLQLRIGYPAVDSFGGFRLMPSKRP